MHLRWLIHMGRDLMKFVVLLWMAGLIVPIMRVISQLRVWLSRYQQRISIGKFIYNPYRVLDVSYIPIYGRSLPRGFNLDLFLLAVHGNKQTNRINHHSVQQSSQ